MGAARSSDPLILPHHAAPPPPRKSHLLCQLRDGGVKPFRTTSSKLRRPVIPSPHPTSQPMLDLSHICVNEQPCLCTRDPKPEKHRSPLQSPPKSTHSWFQCHPRPASGTVAKWSPGMPASHIALPTFQSQPAGDGSSPRVPAAHRVRVLEFLTLSWPKLLLASGG